MQNTDKNEAITIDETYSTMYVTREGGFVRSGLDSVDEVEIFQGSENKVTLIQTYSKKFHCTYLLQTYPFDTQVGIKKDTCNGKNMLCIRFAMYTWS